MKLRLILMKPQSDSEGVCVGKFYETTVVDVDDRLKEHGWNVIGGEWLPDAVQGEGE